MPRVPSLEAARAALRDGQRDLISPSYAACHSGVNYYCAFVEKLKSEFPSTPFTFTLCCGDNSAIAHDALRLGFTSVLCDCSPAILTQLQAIAHPLGATVKSPLDPQPHHAIPNT